LSEMVRIGVERVVVEQIVAALGDDLLFGCHILRCVFKL
jgi:hypothetical protein